MAIRTPKEWSQKIGANNVHFLEVAIKMDSLMRPCSTASDTVSTVLTQERSILNLQNSVMSTNVVARIYIDGSVEYVPPSDLEHPPAESEMRITLEEDSSEHLQQFNGGHWVELGEVTDALLKKHGLDDLSGS
jgi:hypothetical protein